MVPRLHVLLLCCVLLLCGFFNFGSFGGWHVFAEGGGQIDLMVLFLDQDLADLFGHGVLA